MLTLYATSPGAGDDDRSSLSHPDYVNPGNLGRTLSSTAAFVERG